MALASHIANIGERGARRRRRTGIVLSAVAVATLIILFVVHAPHWTRLLVGVPAGLAAVEILQAREKT